MTCIEFLLDNTNFWLVAVGWDGKMVFIKHPMFQKNSYTVALVLKKAPHSGDIYTLDHVDAFLATGGVDNKVCIWNSVAGTVRSIIKMPKRDGRFNIFVNLVRFTKTKQAGYDYPVILLFVVQNNGDLFCVNPVTEIVSKRVAKLVSNPFMEFNGSNQQRGQPNGGEISLDQQGRWPSEQDLEQWVAWYNLL